MSQIDGELLHPLLPGGWPRNRSVSLEEDLQGHGRYRDGSARPVAGRKNLRPSPFTSLLVYLWQHQWV